MERRMWMKMMIAVVYIGTFMGMVRLFSAFGYIKKINIPLYEVKEVKGKKCECGLSGRLEKQDEENASGNIVNPPYKYPWMVSLSLFGKHYCEGSIISDYFVLTAAHCVIQPKCFEPSEPWSDCFIDPDLLLIHFVSHVAGFGGNLTIESIIGHPKFRTWSIMYDIALLKTTRKMPCSLMTTPICLPINLNLLKTSTKAIAVARAEKSRKANVPWKNTLHEMHFRILSKKECRRKFETSTNAHFCAVGNWQYMCKGASGGPLFVKHKGRYYAIGVTSAGNKDDCDAPTLEFFTRVQTFLPWIQQEANLE